MLEVELKAHLADIAPEEIAMRCKRMGFQAYRKVREVDIYFNGPNRDFRDTDEALRLRSCTDLSDGSKGCYMTYKGPKLGRRSNARTEHEVSVSDLRTAEKLLSALGCRLMYTVDKVRQELRLNEVTLCLDTVAGLGCFLELESLVSEDGSRETAEARLLDMLGCLGIPGDWLTSRSYLALLIERDPARLQDYEKENLPDVKAEHIQADTLRFP